MAEIVSTFDVNQFQPGRSLDACGPFSVSLMAAAGKAGSATNHNASWVIAEADKLYTQYIGADTTADAGTSQRGQIYQMIQQEGCHYQNLYPDGGVSQSDLPATIVKWVKLGYPVIIQVPEDNVYDLGLKRKPYNWDTTGYHHIFSVTGVASNNWDILVRDTANVIATGPRTYGMTQLQNHFDWATVFVPSWLSRPASATPPSTSTSTTTTTTQSSGDDEMLTLDDSVVKQYFVAGPTTTSWRCKSNGVILQGANLTFYRSNGGPAMFGLPLSNEIYLSAYPNTAIVPCERAIPVFDPSRKIDHPPIPDTQQCYLLHINNGVGQTMIAKPLTDALNKTITTLNTDIATYKTQIASMKDASALETQVQTLQSQLTAAQTQVTKLQGIIKQINQLSAA